MKISSANINHSSVNHTNENVKHSSTRHKSWPSAFKWFTNVWVIQLHTSITTECKADHWFPPVRHDWESVPVLSWDIAASCGRLNYWLSTSTPGSVADLWFSQIVKSSPCSTDTPSSYKSSGCMSSWIHQDWMSCSSHEALACAGPACERVTRSVSAIVWPFLSGCHGNPQQSPGVVFHGVLSVVCRCMNVCLTGNFGKSITHGASLPVRFPACLALHSPPDGKCLLLITHRWAERAEKCVHICVCLPVTLFIFVTVHPKDVAH